MIEELEATKRALRAVEANLAVLHEKAAKVRDNAPNGSSKAAARKIAERVERAIQQLERIE